VINGPDYCDLSPKQIVPALADTGCYLASESTMYRLLRERRLIEHRGRAKPPRCSRPDELVATGPNQVWSWDITYLQSPVRGQFFFLYLIIDVFSRKIVGRAVHETESAAHAAVLIAAACAAENIARDQLVIHSDNGGPMKGAAMLATLQQLGVVPSFSRPHVSDDNPYSEAIFKTMKYRPEYPSTCFASIEAARMWVDLFVAWYNNAHLHSGIGFVAPITRHAGDDVAILAKRREVYEAAKLVNPARWSRHVRTWSRIAAVSLNPRDERPAVAVA
jgi:putative transposase